MSSAHFSTEQLSRYIEGELPQAEAEQVSRHLERCGRCREQMESLQRMLVTLGRLPDLAPSPGFLARLEERMAARRSVWRRLADGLSLGFLPLPARAAALAVGVLVAVGVFWYGQQPSAPLRSERALRLAKERKSPSKPPGPAMLAPERGMALQQDLDTREEPAAQRQWFSYGATDAETSPAPAHRAERTKELAQKEDRLGLLEQPMPVKAAAPESFGEESKEALLAERITAPQTRQALSPEEIEGLTALGYLGSRDEAASKPRREALKRKDLQAGAFLGVERVEPEGTDLAFGAGQSLSSESAAPEAPAEALGRQLGDFVRPMAEEKAAQTELQVADTASLPVSEGESQVTGYAGIAVGGEATLFAKEELEAVELLVSSPHPQETAEALRAWLAEKRWSGGQPALAVEDGTVVLTARVPADSVREATEAILAQANRLTAQFAGRPLAEYDQAGNLYFQRYPADVPASRRSRSQSAFPRESAPAEAASEATEARRLRKAGRPEVVATSLPQITYRQIRIQIIPGTPQAE